MTIAAPAATSTAFTASELGALLAQHPVGWWLVGMFTLALLGACALSGLRTLRHHVGPPLNRFFPAQAPGLMLAAMATSACVLVLLGATLAELAERGSAAGAWGTLDDTLAADLQAHAPMAVVQWFATLTHLGDTWVLTALALCVTAALWLRQQRLLAIGWLVAMAGNGALTKVLKNIFERVRPEHTHGLAEANGYSFPSGHSSASMVAYAMLAYLATRLLPRAWHLPAAMVAGALIFTTGWSRIVLQVHYASDVLAGWLLGGTWMVCTVLVIESVARWRHQGNGAPAQA